MRILIVDDEESARSRLRALLEEEGGAEIAGECSTGDQAIRAILSHSPDLVFLDAQLSDMDGMEVVRRVGPSRFPLVIFVTGFDRYAVAAFDIHACDYLLKPFSEERFREALGRARDALRRREILGLDERISGLLEKVRSLNGYAKRILVREEGRIRFFDVDDIDWIEADAKYVRLHAGGEVTPLKESIGRLERRLDPSRFLRVHRSAIVNLDRVSEIDGPEAGAQWVVLRNGERLPLSRANRPKLFEIADETAAVESRKPGVDSIS